MQKELVSQLSTALHAPAERFAVAETYGAGKYVIIDVMPTIGTGVNRICTQGVNRIIG